MTFGGSLVFMELLKPLGIRNRGTYLGQTLSGWNYHLGMFGQSPGYGRMGQLMSNFSGGAFITWDVRP